MPVPSPAHPRLRKLLKRGKASVQNPDLAGRGNCSPRPEGTEEADQFGEPILREAETARWRDMRGAGPQQYANELLAEARPPGRWPGRAKSTRPACPDGNSRFAGRPSKLETGGDANAGQKLFRVRGSEAETGRAARPRRSRACGTRKPDRSRRGPCRITARESQSEAERAPDDCPFSSASRTQQQCEGLNHAAPQEPGAVQRRGQSLCEQVDLARTRNAGLATSARLVWPAARTRSDSANETPSGRAGPEKPRLRLPMSRARRARLHGLKQADGRD